MEIYIQLGDGQTGPFSEDEVCAMVTSGRAMRSDLSWREGMAEWQPLEQVVTLPPRPAPPPAPQGLPRPPAGLPPIPARVRPEPAFSAASLGTFRSSSTIPTVSGVIALILGLLTIFNIGGCMNARSKLTKFQSGDNALDGVDMLVDTARGVNEGDPLRGLSGLLGKAHSLQDDYQGFQLEAWLCLVGTVVAGGVYRFSQPVKAP